MLEAVARLQPNDLLHTMLDAGMRRTADPLLDGMLHELYSAHVERMYADTSLTALAFHTIHTRVHSQSALVPLTRRSPRMCAPVCEESTCLSHTHCN